MNNANPNNATTDMLITMLILMLLLPVEPVLSVRTVVRPVHLLRVSLLRVLESNFPGDSLYNYMDMIVPTP